MPETTPLIKAALNLRGGAGFDVYKQNGFLCFTYITEKHKTVQHKSQNVTFCLLKCTLPLRMESELIDG